jgi:predicted ATP-grasp superfamily ATP-dependent carboligase
VTDRRTAVFSSRHTPKPPDVDAALRLLDALVAADEFDTDTAPLERVAAELADRISM